MSDLSEAVRMTFARASLVHEASKKLNADEWRGYQEIRKRYDAQRRFLERTYRQEYDTRFEQARADLLREAGSWKDDFKPRFSVNDRFDSQMLNRRAHRIVQDRHQSDLSKNARAEDQAIQNLLAKSQTRQASPKDRADDTYNNVDKKIIRFSDLTRNTRPRGRER